jgi:hypothetical protein
MSRHYFRTSILSAVCVTVLLSCTPIFAQTGPGKALSFSGDGSYVWANRPVTNDFTIEFWFQSSQVAGGEGQWWQGMGLVDGEVAGAANDFGVSLGNGKVLFGMGNADTTIRSDVVADGVWHHVAATREQSSGAMVLYVDGTQVASGSGSTESRDASDQIRIGSIQTGNNFYNGLIDEIRIWDVARSQTQIRSNQFQSLTGSEAGLVAYWRCDDGSGTTLTDSTGHGDDGTLVDNPTWVLSTVPLGGTSNAPSVHTGPAINIGGTNATLTATVNPGNLGTAVWFEWGTTSAYGSTTATNILAATNLILDVSTYLPGLSSRQTYHYRVVATNSDGLTRGLDQVFYISQFLGFASRAEGPAAGMDSVVVGYAGDWAATTGASWLHLSATNGTGSTNLVYTLDVNPGNTRTGTITVAGQTLSVVQAGAGYVLAAPLTTLVSCGSISVTVDDAGNVYFGEEYYASDWVNAIGVWNMTNQTVTTLIPGSRAFSIAVDHVGHLFIADVNSDVINEWNIASQALTTLNSGLGASFGVTVDDAGNVYMASASYDVIEKWDAATQTFSTPVSGGYLFGTAVDAAGDLYAVDQSDLTIKEWTAQGQYLGTLVSGLNNPYSMAVDGAGNVYVADDFNYMIKERSAVDQSTNTLASGLDSPCGVAVDAAGNVYIADYSAVREKPRAFVNATPVAEGANAGRDALPPVLPVTENLTGPFAPYSDQDWLTITGVSNGVVSFSITTNTTYDSRTANITVLGQTIPVTQAPMPTAPVFGAAFRMSTTFQLQFAGTSNSAYVVLSTTNLLVPLSDWQRLAPIVEITPGVYQFTDTGLPASRQRYYRLQWP